MKKQLLAFLLWLGFAGGVWGQTPVLIKDISPGTGQSIAFDNASKRANALMNGILYFAADNSTHGLELWRSDGTESGTYMVKDILPGSRTASSDPQDFFVHKGVLYFLANDGVNGYELWKSDGTETGTTLLKDMRSGAGGSDISHYAVINDEVQFWNSYTGELWKTNGTPTGTVKLANLQGLGGFSNPVASSAVVVKGVWYFQANDSKGTELWRCDGTQAGVQMVKDINPFGNSVPTELTNVNDILYFSADDGVYGRELWKSDGTAAGTVLVRDITAGGNGTNMNLIGSDKLLYLHKYTESRGFIISELWKSDGTAAGTVLVHNPGKSFLYGLTQTATTGSTFFYSFDEEVYRTDISKGGVQRVTYPPLTEPGNPANKAEARLNISFSLFSSIDNQLHFLTQDQSPFYTGLGSIYQINKVSGADTVAQAVSYPSGYRMIGLLNRNNRTFFFVANNPQAGIELHRVDVCAHSAKINAANGTSFCPGSSVAITAEGSGGTGAYTYKWRLGTSDVGTNPNLFITKAGTYVVEVTNQGCSVSTSVEITQTTNLPVSISGINTVCAGTATPLSATVSGGVAPYTYQWKQAGGNIVGATTATLSATTTGTYSVSATDSKGCTGTSSGFGVTVKPTPVASITTATTSLTSGASAVLVTPAASGQTYQWYKGGQAIAGATNNTFTIKEAGDYTVTVTRDGCSATSQAITLVLVLATEPTPTSLGLDISPNPVIQSADVRLNMVKAAPATFTLIDGAGKVVGEWQSTQTRNVHELTLPMKSQTAGVYFLRVEANGLQAVRRILKQ